MKRVGFVLTLAVALTLVADRASAVIVFDDFNVNEGHFTYDPNTSPTSQDAHGNSTADRVTHSAPREGVGHQMLVLNYQDSNSSATPGLRIRHLSGDGLANPTPADNVSFTTSGGTDGHIGFWLKTTVTGMETQIALDVPSNSTSGMWGGTPIAIIGDGEWHLYEWDLDAPVWGSVPPLSSQVTGALPNNTYTIDSIFFRDPDGTDPSPSGTYFLDFVAKSDSGSIAAITPAAIPEASSFLAVGLAGLSALGIVWSRKKHAAAQRAA